MRIMQGRHQAHTGFLQAYNFHINKYIKLSFPCVPQPREKGTKMTSSAKYLETSGLPTLKIPL